MPVASRFALVRMLRSLRSRTSSLTLPSSRYRRKIHLTSSLRFARVHPYLPSPTERSKHRSEAKGNVGQGTGQAVLGLKQVLLRSQHGGKRRRALLVLLQRDSEGAICRLDAASQKLGLVTRLQIGHQSVVY